MYPTFKIDKPIRLIELFAGYGSTALAWKYLGVQFEHWKICEWATKSIQAYKDIHFTDEDIECNLSKEQLIDYLTQKGISSNYNEPMAREQISRLGYEKLSTIWKNIQITHNLVNIKQAKGCDFEICNTDKYTYIMSYSFPCQDLSLAGLRKGIKVGTRSGMLFEVERILDELKTAHTLPTVLLMENVPQVHGAGNEEAFRNWMLKLESLGYSNYWKDLIATDYGIPQTRNRTFMVSILGEYNYSFPTPVSLKIRLKDMLEDNVDEKYYLSDEMLSRISKWNSHQNPLDGVLGMESVSLTITTRVAESIDGGMNASMKLVSDDFDNTENIRKQINVCLNDSNLKINAIKVIANYSPSEHEASRIIDSDYASPTVKGNHGTVNEIIEKRLDETLSSNKPIEDTGFIDLYSRSIKEDGTSGCVTTRVSQGGNLFVWKKEVVRVGGLYDKDGETHQAGSFYDPKGMCPTIDTSSGGYRQPMVIGGVGDMKSNSGTQYYLQDRIYDGDVANTVNTCANPYYVETVVVRDNGRTIDHQIDNAQTILARDWKGMNTYGSNGVVEYGSKLRIRKLTPRTCFRLMGVHDDDFDKCARNQSDSSLYHLAGDSIVVNVLMAIYKQML